MVFSVGDVLPGTVTVKVNIKAPTPSDVGLWHCFIRVGSSDDSVSAIEKKCRDPNPKTCKAEFALMHITKTASVYVESVDVSGRPQPGRRIIGT
ncbi:hypothetical protein B0T09DRAFT_333893 [Sordaria sp. MPI-SDFR-AT-0083]|nr:hypothetical protein B0T09DRAFT_333893 [Sordaria sp. MPI-SDFR-AT-0083]